MKASFFYTTLFIAALLGSRIHSDPLVIQLAPGCRLKKVFNGWLGQRSRAAWIQIGSCSTTCTSGICWAGSFNLVKNHAGSRKGQGPTPVKQSAKQKHNQERRIAHSKKAKEPTQTLQSAMRKHNRKRRIALGLGGDSSVSLPSVLLHHEQCGYRSQWTVTKKSKQLEALRLFDSPQQVPFMHPIVEDKQHKKNFDAASVTKVKAADPDAKKMRFTEVSEEPIATPTKGKRKGTMYGYLLSTPESSKKEKVVMKQTPNVSVFWESQKPTRSPVLVKSSGKCKNNFKRAQKRRQV
jgi:hypothetical protein